MAIRETSAGHEALGLDEDDLRRMHYYMLLARRVDERSWIPNRQGKAAFVISCQGQEAAQVGAAYNLRPGNDFLYPYYRDSGMTLLLGQTPRDQFLSLLGKKEDQNSGEDGVVLVCGGEASTSGGDWHEAMNFAGIHDLPLVFLVENNVYAISVHAEFQVAGSIAKRAEGYGFPGHEVDGNDVLAVYEVAREAFGRARTGEGPTLIEAKTYRMTAHSSDDDARRYREREELEEWRKKDPIVRFEKYLMENGVLDDSERDEISERIKAEVAEASEYAENAPFADPEDVLLGVYAEA